MTIPYQTLTTSQRLPNASFALSTLFTTKGFLAQSNLFQGSYPAGLVNDKYDLSLFYLVSSYLYFLIWFIFLTQRFASAYKQRIFHSVLASTRALSFVSTFARYNYATRASTDKAKSEGMFQRIYLDLMLDDRRTADGTSKPTKTVKLRLKMIITNLFYVVLALVLSEHRRHSRLVFDKPPLPSNRCCQLDCSIFVCKTEHRLLRIDHLSGSDQSAGALHHHSANTSRKLRTGIVQVGCGRFQVSNPVNRERSVSPRI